ncbi:MAG: hypothetical protein AAF089_01235 [Bacteroidota bacterium]
MKAAMMPLEESIGLVSWQLFERALQTLRCGTPDFVRRRASQVYWIEAVKIFPDIVDWHQDSTVGGFYEWRGPSQTLFEVLGPLYPTHQNHTRVDIKVVVNVGNDFLKALSFSEVRDCVEASVRSIQGTSNKLLRLFDEFSLVV